MSAPDEAIMLAEGEPILTSLPQTLAVTLQVVVNLREYGASTSHTLAARTAVNCGHGCPRSSARG